MKREELKKTKTYLRYLDYHLAKWEVPKAWCVRFDLTPTELLIFEEIHQATHHWQKNCFCGSRSGLCAIINGTPPTVDKALLNLRIKGFITKIKAPIKTQRGGDRQNICYKSLLPRDIEPNDKEIEELLELNIRNEIRMGRYAKK